MTVASTRRTSAAPRSAGRTAVVVPGPAEGASKSWRRMVTSVDPAKGDAFALDGTWLEPGRAFEITVGAVVVACDVFDDHRLIRMLTVEVGGLAEVKAWDQKRRLGRRALNFVAGRLPKGLLCSARALEALPNKWAGRCVRCRQDVDAGAGQFVEEDGRRRVAHLNGACPPRPPLISRFDGNCRLCRGWITAGHGHAVKDSGRWEVEHPGGACPPVPEPAPNLYDGWCRDCREIVPAGTGVFDRGPCHRDGCPEPTVAGPTWTVHRRAGALEPGRVLRARLRPWGNEPPVPESAPGYRVLDEHGLVHAVVTVVSALGRDARFNARVRIATEDEAADVLAEQIQFVPDAIPDPAGFRAPWNAERIGTPASVLSRMRETGYLLGRAQPVRGTPWVAEITGRTRTGWVLDFLRPNIDRSESNSAGTRGVQYHWDLKINRVYRAYYPVSWSEAERVFLRANPDGTVREIEREEVEAWLDTASAWTFSLPLDGA
ncbi:hypothetical protein [Amycolatopsis sp. NPDC004079]|uniref:hypothetical protein n=1 Tax=Amycolatopsis sp. NPDC004079 TaxID=3154549 RepID=UPI0033AECF54